MTIWSTVVRHSHNWSNRSYYASGTGSIHWNVHKSLFDITRVPLFLASIWQSITVSIDSGGTRNLTTIYESTQPMTLNGSLGANCLQYWSVTLSCVIVEVWVSRLEKLFPIETGEATMTWPWMRKRLTSAINERAACESSCTCVSVTIQSANVSRDFVNRRL